MKIVKRVVSRLALSRGWPQTRGTIDGLALRGRVVVRRDAWGVPHVRAENLQDLMFAQGFVHAQDRLWQMESLRRLSEGRLSEIAGPATLDLDFFCRMIGMPDMKRRVTSALSEEERGLLECYAAGVNGYLGACGKRLPFEFTSLGFTPEPWTVEDCASVLPYLSWWLLFTHYAEELLAVASGRQFSLHEWNDLFPSHPGAKLPPDPFFDSLARLKLGELHPGALGFHADLSGSLGPEARRASLQADALRSPQGGGSNNWVVARGSDGHPLLANDPHLGVSLPSVWYLCHLHVPGTMNVAGASIPGVPGIIIGRTEDAAWGLTNVCLDAADILIFRVLPDRPTHYRVGDRVLEMRRQELRFGVRGGKSLELPLYSTQSGPAITAVREGVEAVAVLKWYGTLADQALTDRSFRGVFTFMKARSASEVLEGARHWAYASQNFVAADRSGHIGWHASGVAPIRNGYTGRLPADGTAGAEWTGFLPFESLPQRMDPPEGWIATANYLPDGHEASRPLSYVWMPPYRLQRITERLSSMRSPSIEDFQRLQMDLHSTQADRLLPKALGFPFTDPEAAQAARILRSWDREVRSESPGAALYEVFLAEFGRELLAGRLGDSLGLYRNAKAYAIEDEILDRPDSPWWKGSPARTVERALASAYAVCVRSMGAEASAWRWGKLHRHGFRHPGATSRLLSWLLDPPAREAHGDCNTVNVAWYLAAGESHRVTTVPSMRMIVPLGDVDGMRIIAPLGQCGQAGHRHYHDMLDLWIRGDTIPLPLSEPRVQRITRETLVLDR